MHPGCSPRCIPSLTPAARDPAYCTFTLPGGVMVAQVTLTHLVMVRIHAGQPFDAGLVTLGPCSWPAARVEWP